jgi:hypothetical protein
MACHEAWEFHDRSHGDNLYVDFVGDCGNLFAGSVDHFSSGVA